MHTHVRSNYSEPIQVAKTLTTVNKSANCCCLYVKNLGTLSDSRVAQEWDRTQALSQFTLKPLPTPHGNR